MDEMESLMESKEPWEKLPPVPDEFGNTYFEDGSVLYGVGFFEYFRAIQEAPPNTLIKMGELKPLQWMRCTDCGAEMDKALCEAHEAACSGGKA